MNAAVAAGALLLSTAAGAAAAEVSSPLDAQVSSSSDAQSNAQSNTRAIAQANSRDRTTTSTTSSTAIASSASLDYQTLYVNPTSGNDSADGIEDQPLQTVTRALEIAEPNTVIVLAPGRYTQSSGEVFPLQLKSGVTIQGTPGERDRTAIIEGGGNFDSPLRSQQNAAVIAADRAGIAQVAISNPDGYGLWIESASPTILASAFVGNRQTGIYVTDGSPRVQGSYFSGNQVAGLIVFGDSSANIQSNTFDRTGDAIRVVDGATPEIVGNRMTNNEAGLVLIGNARPMLRDNQSVGNRRNDVVEVSASEQQLQPVTQLAVSRTSEPAILPAISRSAVSEPAASESASESVSESVASGPEVSESVATGGPEVSESAARELVANRPSLSQLRSRAAEESDAEEMEAVEADVEESDAEEADVAQSSEPEAGAPGSALAALRSGVSGGVSEGAASDLALAPRAVTEGNPDSPVTRPRNGRDRPGRSSEPAERSSERSAPSANSNRLAVPSTSIPIGSGESAYFPTPGGGSGGGVPVATSSRAQDLGLYYRVFVEASSSSAQDEVREVVPDAFRTRFEGETVMQVGAFPSEDEAEDRKRMLEDNDLEARVEYVR